MSQRRLYHSPPHMTGRELEYLADVIQSNWIAPVGPHLDQFEQMLAERMILTLKVVMAQQMEQDVF